MKTYSAALLVVLVSLLLAAGLADAAVRTVLVEGFTQWNCGPCASWNPTERGILNTFTRDTVVAIKYHVSWPNPNNDAFYLWNTTEVDARVNFYDVSWVPWVMVDGTLDLSDVNANLLRSYVRQRRAIAAPCTIDLMAYVSGASSVNFSGTVTATDSALNNARLYVVLTSDLVTYTSAPGGNGERQFPDVFRDMWPNSQGQVVNLALGGTHEFQGTLNKDASWDANGLSIIAFLQNYGTHWMHQAAWEHVDNFWSFSLETTDPHQLVGTMHDETIYYILMNNIGDNDDSYTVSLSGDLPVGWTRGVEAIGVPVGSDSINVEIGSGQQTILSLHAHPNGHPGNALLNVNVRSHGNPEMVQTESFRLMAGLDVLVVDDDGGSTYGNYESYFTQSLANVAGNRRVGYWDNGVNPITDSPDLSEIGAVVWFIGNSPYGSTLSLAEQTLLQIYLGGGGRLFLTGQGIAYDLRLSSFLTDYLHAASVMPYVNGRSIACAASEPICDGLTVSIQGEGGANNQARQTAINAYDNDATICWEYAGSSYHAGLRVETEAYRAVFFAFGFEAIADSAVRDTVMARTLCWLLDAAVADPREEILPREFLLGQNYPNPFNPETVIPFSLPAMSDVTLKVYDLLGREVAVIASGRIEAGAHTARWQANGVPSGLYFYRIEAVAGDQSYQATRKLMILK